MNTVFTTRFPSMSGPRARSHLCYPLRKEIATCHKALRKVCIATRS